MYRGSRVSTPLNQRYVALGAAMIAAVLGLLWLAGNVERLRRQAGQRYTVALVDGVGLPLGSPVRLAGVDVGAIEAVEIIGGKPVFTLVVEPGIELHSDAAAGPRAKSLLGQKYIELRPGSEAAPLLPAGEAIPNTWDNYEVDEALNALEPVVGDDSLLAVGDRLEQLFGGEQASLESDSQDAAEQLASALERVPQLRTDIREVRTRVEGVHEELPTRIADVNAALTSPELDRSLNELDRLTSSLGDGERLFDAGERALQEVDGAVAELDAFAKGITPERVAELDELLSEAASASASARERTAAMQGFGEDSKPLLATLELLARKATAIDELTIRKFLQEEGFLTRFGGGDRKQAHERLDELEQQEQRP